tara:strand:+ start:3177 stop:4157 length:981 start_codon:yes stop_codon:yes gene_type:complete
VDKFQKGFRSGANNQGTDFLNNKNIEKTSPINVCFISNTSAGSWEIRGKQIAAMRANWKAINKPNEAIISESDIICVVKKPNFKLINLARKKNKPIVYDIVDSWEQPNDDALYINDNQAKKLFSKKWNEINADAYIFPTKNMEKILGNLVNNKATIYHHYWPHIKINPIRKNIKKVGYEGVGFLGEWEKRIEKICKKRDIEFIINPNEFTDMDIVVLTRGGDYASYLARNFKSNVKLANAMGSGTPALIHYNEMSAHDTDSGDSLFFTDKPGSFERQLDRLIESYTLRKTIHENYITESYNYSIDTICDKYEFFFQEVLRDVRHKP